MQARRCCSTTPAWTAHRIGCPELTGIKRSAIKRIPTKHAAQHISKQHDCGWHAARMVCIKQGTSVRAGDALLFYNLRVDGSQDVASMHTSCPVLDGLKWTATKWLHTTPFHAEWLDLPAEPADDAQLPDECTDTHSSCRAWASTGALPRIRITCTKQFVGGAYAHPQFLDAQ